MKIFKISFSIFAFTITLVTAVVVIFNPKVLNHKYTAVIYANSICISNTPREINVYAKNDVEFINTPYEIEPSTYNQGVRIALTNSTGVISEDITNREGVYSFANSGIYYVRYYVKTKQNKEIYDTIKFNVLNDFDKCDIAIKLLTERKNASINQPINILNDYSLKESSNSVLSSSCVTGSITNNIYLSETATNDIATLSLTNNGIKVSADLLIVVNDNTLCSITMTDDNNQPIANNSTLEIHLSDSNKLLLYEVQNISNQQITMSNNSNTYFSVLVQAPMIIITPISLGTQEIVFNNTDLSCQFTLVISIID